MNPALLVETRDDVQGSLCQAMKQSSSSCKNNFVSVDITTLSMSARRWAREEHTTCSCIRRPTFKNGNIHRPSTMIAIIRLTLSFAVGSRGGRAIWGRIRVGP